MIVDAHQHAFWHGKDDAGLVADMDEQGIAFAWLLTWEIPPGEGGGAWAHCLNPLHARPDGSHAGIPLADILTARNRFPSRFVAGYAPHPLMGDAAALFESAYKIHGVRVCGEWKCRMLLDDPRCIALFRKAGELGCPVTFHLDVPYLPDAETGELKYSPHWYGGELDNLERTLRKCPDTIFVGHAPGFWRHISGDADSNPGSYPKGPVTPGGRLHGLFEACPNLYADLSAGSALNALRRDPEHAREFLARFQDRLLYARDYYGGELTQFLDSLGLPSDLQQKIQSGNALRLVAAPT